VRGRPGRKAAQRRAGRARHAVTPARKRKGDLPHEPTLQLLRLQSAPPSSCARTRRRLASSLRRCPAQQCTRSCGRCSFRLRPSGLQTTQPAISENQPQHQPPPQARIPAVRAPRPVLNRALAVVGQRTRKPVRILKGGRAEGRARVGEDRQKTPTPRALPKPIPPAKCSPPGALNGRNAGG
jgi:hypothetical protein